MKKRPFLAGFFLGVTTGAVIAFFMLISASTTPEFSLDNFTFTNLDGVPIITESLQGKAVIVNIWATWCPPCVKEMPGIQTAYSVIDKDVVFLIASDESAEKILKFKEKRNLDLPFCRFKMLDSAKLSEGRPQTYIFSKTGELKYHRLGAFDWADPAALEKIRSYLK